MLHARAARPWAQAGHTRAARIRFLDRASFACLPPTVAPHPQIDIVEAAAVSTVAAHECGTGAASRPRCYSRCGAAVLQPLRSPVLQPLRSRAPGATAAAEPEGRSGGAERVAAGAAAAAGRKKAGGPGGQLAARCSARRRGATWKVGRRDPEKRRCSQQPRLQ